MVYICQNRSGEPANSKAAMRLLLLGNWKKLSCIQDVSGERFVTLRATGSIPEDLEAQLHAGFKWKSQTWWGDTMCPPTNQPRKLAGTCEKSREESVLFTLLYFELCFRILLPTSAPGAVRSWCSHTGAHMAAYFCAYFCCTSGHKLKAMIHLWFALAKEVDWLLRNLHYF